MWGYIIVAVVLYFVLRKRIKQIKDWIKRHKEFIEKWKNVPEILEAYKALKAAVEAANLDRKWTILEILTVLGLAVKLFEEIRKYEEKE